VHDRKSKKTHQFDEKLGREVTVDTVVTFDLDEPALGLKAGGIGAVFGESE
jgi:hypothetical protein